MVVSLGVSRVIELTQRPIVMRALADGRVRWGFWPHGADLSDREGKGIWLDTVSGGELGEASGEERGLEGSETLSDVEEDSGSGGEDESDDVEDDEQTGDEDVGEEPMAVRENRGGFFAALDGGSDEDEDDDEAE
jgi:hypothetical protein